MYPGQRSTARRSFGHVPPPARAAPLTTAPLTPAAIASLAAAAGAWPQADAAPGLEGSAIELRVAGRVFATLSETGVELRLPPRVRDMLVETGRAEALPHPRCALVRPDEDGGCDPDLLRLAYERARIAGRAGGPAGEPA